MQDVVPNKQHGNEQEPNVVPTSLSGGESQHTLDVSRTIAPSTRASYHQVFPSLANFIQVLKLKC